MSNPAVYLDLDYTLFDSDRFLQFVGRILEQHFGLQSAAFLAEVPRFYTSQDRAALRMYCFFDQVRANGLSVDAVETTLRQSAADQDFAYADTAAFVAFMQMQASRTTVLTFGEKRYQLLKYATAPGLRALPVVVTDTAKIHYLQAHEPTGQGILVDDKQEAVPANFKHVWMNRTVPAATYASLKAVQADWARITAA